MLDEIKENEVPNVPENQEQQQVPQILQVLEYLLGQVDSLNDPLLQCIFIDD